MTQTSTIVCAVVCDVDFSIVTLRLIPVLFFSNIMALSLSRHKNFVQFQIIGCIRSPVHYQVIR